MIQIRGEWVLPNSMKSQAKRGIITTKAGWRRVFKGVEAHAMGPGGILEQNMRALQAEVPLQPSTIARKAAMGLPLTPLVGKRGRILKAVKNSVKTYRKRSVYKRRKGGYGCMIRFNPNKFKGTTGMPYTASLQGKRRIKGGKTKGWPIMSYRHGNDRLITPAMTDNIGKEMVRQIMAHDRRAAKRATRA